MRVKYELAKSLSAKVRIAESPIADFRGHSLTKTVLESPRKAATLSRTFCCPRKSSNVRDFRTKTLHMDRQWVNRQLR